MRRIVTAAAWVVLCALVVTGSRPASADVLVNISKSSQRVSVLVDGTSRYNWKVSTGTKNYTTPSGVYKPQWLARRWRSKKYNNAPMPHSIFFHEGYAIHGTTEIARLGRIASHGCVRLHPENAATLYQLVEKQMATTRVVVSDDAIDIPDETPKKKKPNQFIAENGATDKRSAKGFEAVALVRQEAALRENPPVAAKVGSSETPKAKSDRRDHAEKAARSRGGGFRW